MDLRNIWRNRRNYWNFKGLFYILNVLVKKIYLPKYLIYQKSIGIYFREILLLACGEIIFTIAPTTQTTTPSGIFKKQFLENV